MLKGLLIGMILLIAGDLALNQGRYSHLATQKLAQFAHASHEAVANSLFAPNGGR